VILQRTPPGAVVTPAMTVESDVFRCVIAGSYELGGQTLEMGDTLVRAGGQPWEAALAGKDGVDEVIVIGDRRGAITPQDSQDSEWTDAINAIVARQISQLPALAGV
jgi:hypothetical protein